MNVVKIFLAASAELGEEKREFEIFIYRENKRLKDQNVFLQLVVWEHFIDASSKISPQDAINEAINTCEIFVALFSTKIGKYTKEEFQAALERYKKGANPQYIFTFFKNQEVRVSNIDKTEISHFFSFQNQLKDLGHYYTTFTSTSDLFYSFHSQLEKILISKNPLKTSERNGIFISYSHKNTDYLNETLLFLKPLEKKGLIKTWSDKQIRIGANWKNSIKEGLLKAKVGLLLITQDYLASDFITDEEVPELIRSTLEEGTIILPVIFEPCTIQFEEELMQFQFFNSPNKPFSSLTMHERKTEFVRLASSLNELLYK